MNKTQALTFLTEINHLHLLKYFDQLSAPEQMDLLKDVENLKKEHSSLQEAQKSLSDEVIYPVKNYQVYETFINEMNPTLKELGNIGTVIFAGGQGTRLGFEGPKGCFPLSPIKNKTTFQIFAEKTFYASQASKQLLPLAIMTSSFNHQQTVQYFKTNNYFGLKQEQVSFFQQSNTFMTDDKGNYFLDSKYSIAKSPGGNGTFFESFVKSGLFDTWQSLGIVAVNIIPVDNPLADPFDFQFLNYHLQHKNEVSLKCIERKDPYEKVGIVVLDPENKVVIREYSEIDDCNKLKKDPHGKLEHCCANTGMICLNLTFIKKVLSSHIPYHLAHKKAKFLDKEGHIRHPDTPNANKREKFIFDTFSLSKKTGVVLCQREECFAPLKNNEGFDSIESVKKAMLKRDSIQWKKVVSEKPPFLPFELSQEFYYRQNKVKRWQNEGHYIFIDET